MPTGPTASRSATAQTLIDVSVSHEALLEACTDACVALERLSPVVRALVAHELTVVKSALALARRSDLTTGRR